MLAALGSYGLAVVVLLTLGASLAIHQWAPSAGEPPHRRRTLGASLAGVDPFSPKTRRYAYAEIAVAVGLLASIGAGVKVEADQRREREAHHAARNAERAEREAAEAEAARQAAAERARLLDGADAMEATVRQLMADIPDDATPEDALRTLDVIAEHVEPYRSLGDGAEGVVAAGDEAAEAATFLRAVIAAPQTIRDVRRLMDEADDLVEADRFVDARTLYQRCLNSLATIPSGVEGEAVEELSRRARRRLDRIGDDVDEELRRIENTFTLGDFRYVLGRARREDRVGGRYNRERAASGATFIVVEYTIENRDDRTRTVFSDRVYLVDSHGTEYRPDSAAETAAAFEGDRDLFVSELQPYIPHETVSVFQVAESRIEDGFTIEFRGRGLNAERVRFRFGGD